MTTQEPCASHVLARELIEIAKGERQELSESDLFEFGVRAPWEEEEVPGCDTCAGEPPVTFSYFLCKEEEYGEFKTWSELADELKKRREWALDDPETWGIEPVNPSPTERVARVQHLLANAFEFNADGPTPFGLQANRGNQSAFALLDTTEWRTWSRGYLVSLNSAFSTLEDAIRDRASRGTHSASLITEEDVDRMESILKQEGSSHE